ncbi:hypothetical protein TNCT_74601 [Trichonephila clavata]|uniref:Uncharacterized protein n=1 Tax=Trichonephila clavata TaxID=2740835 RepID=A0A8X6J614_TRICU|nr:hypothetical protein TNCT_74601 [Trichonephila clavata]
MRIEHEHFFQKEHKHQPLTDSQPQREILIKKRKEKKTREREWREKTLQFGERNVALWRLITDHQPFRAKRQNHHGNRDGTKACRRETRMERKTRGHVTSVCVTFLFSSWIGAPEEWNEAT